MLEAHKHIRTQVPDSVPADVLFLIITAKI
jgi:hypothetical protein